MTRFVQFFVHVKMFKRFLLPVFCVGLCVNLVIAQKESKTTEKIRGEVGKKLDAYLSRLVDKGFSGAVLAARKDKILLAKGYGFADREKKTPVTKSTVYAIGSVTKQFTAAAIMKLEMQGKLNVDDYITKFFEDVPPDKAKITIHQLLTHSSGIPFRAGRCGAEPTIDDFVKVILSSTLEFEPGTNYRYSNSGYALLGAIVKAASGEPFEQYIYNKLFKPAGMRRTGAFLPKYSVDDIATGYRDGQEWGFLFEKLWGYTELPVKNQRGEPCGLPYGGILSTIDDLYKWHQALKGEKIFSKAIKRKIFAPHVREGEGAGSFYGYGWTIFPTPRKTKLIGHNGDVNSVFQADFRRYVDEEVVFIILTNSLYLEQGAVAVSDRIAQIVFADSNLLFKTKILTFG
jgi:CubicO group peptidase (beta-lactamase class C family)